MTIFCSKKKKVCAQKDKYVPQTGFVLHEHWKGSELRWLPYAHVYAIVFGKDVFVRAIADAFHRFPKHLC